MELLLWRHYAEKCERKQTQTKLLELFNSNPRYTKPSMELRRSHHSTCLGRCRKLFFGADWNYAGQVVVWPICETLQRFPPDLRASILESSDGVFARLGLRPLSPVCDAVGILADCQRRNHAVGSRLLFCCQLPPTLSPDSHRSGGPRCGAFIDDVT